MTIQTKQFNASELCSRKLWQIVTSEADATTPREQLQRAVAELTARRHYLTELSRVGKLNTNKHSA